MLTKLFGIIQRTSRRPTQIIRTTLKRFDFQWRQGSVYTTDTEDIAHLFNAILALKAMPWFPSSVRDIRVFRVDVVGLHHRRKELVHPPLVVWVLVLGLDIPAITVEMHIAVLLAHVHLELLGRAPAFSPVELITQREVAFGK
jgi:hypothetical protein